MRPKERGYTNIETGLSYATPDGGWIPAERIFYSFWLTADCFFSDIKSLTLYEF